MHASLFLISSYLCRLSSLTAASPLVDSACGHLYGAIISSFPFQFTYLFTTHLNVGSPSQPINITGGVLIDEPTPNGTASGPAINGMIKDGLAYPQILENGTLQVPSIVLYGNADDETPFSISELGIGNPSAQVTRIQFDIGGGDKYKTLRDNYILTSINANLDRSRVEVQGYLVTNIASYS